VSPSFFLFPIQRRFFFVLSPEEFPLKLVRRLADTYNSNMPPAKPLSARPKSEQRIPKTITLSRPAYAMIYRAALATGQTHSAVIEFLIRRYSDELIAHDQEVLKSAKL